jgi:hypothetical protein
MRTTLGWGDSVTGCFVQLKKHRAIMEKKSIGMGIDIVLPMELISVLSLSQVAHFAPNHQVLQRVTGALQ